MLHVWLGLQRTQDGRVCGQQQRHLADKRAAWQLKLLAGDMHTSRAGHPFAAAAATAPSPVLIAAR
jgi:hypothetical protein